MTAPPYCPLSQTRGQRAFVASRATIVGDQLAVYCRPSHHPESAAVERQFAAGARYLDIEVDDALKLTERTEV